MGRLAKATQRAQQSGVSPGFAGMLDDADELARLVADLSDENPFKRTAPAQSKGVLLAALDAPAQDVPKTAASPAPKPPAPRPFITLVISTRSEVAPPIASAPPIAAVVPIASVPTPAPSPAPAVVTQDDDKEIKELFFRTYHEKVWCGPQ